MKSKLAKLTLETLLAGAGDAAGLLVLPAALLGDEPVLAAVEAASEPNCAGRDSALDIIGGRWAGDDERVALVSARLPKAIPGVSPAACKESLKLSNRVQTLFVRNYISEGLPVLMGTGLPPAAIENGSA